MGNRILRALLASLFNTVDAIREHINGDDAPDTEAETKAAPKPAAVIVDDEPNPTPITRRRRRQRGRRAMVSYRLVKGIGKGGKLARLLDPERSTLQPVELDVLTAIKANGTITAFALEGATGHGKKSIESAVWRLRKRHGLIESVANGN